MHKIELSKRMKMNADLIPEGCALADIGCDHGYVCIELARKNWCRKIIAMDVNRGPLAIAEKNIRQAKLQDKIMCRISDGLQELETGEVNTILVAGMGGMLISRILRAKPDVVAGVDTLVLQAQSDWRTLRETIWNLGFSIETECICEEAGKYYLAIRAVQGEEDAPYTEEERTYGRLLPKQKNELYRQYLSQEFQKREKVIVSLRKHETEEAEKRRVELLSEQNAIRRILTQYYGG